MATADGPPPLLHSRMADLYRTKVEQLRHGAPPRHPGPQDPAPAKGHILLWVRLYPPLRETSRPPLAIGAESPAIPNDVSRPAISRAPSVDVDSLHGAGASEEGVSRHEQRIQSVGPPGRGAPDHGGLRQWFPPGQRDALRTRAQTRTSDNSRSSLSDGSEKVVRLRSLRERRRDSLRMDRERRLAPQVGLEPTTLRLTAGCSAIELLRNTDAEPLCRTFSLPDPAAGGNRIRHARRLQDMSIRSRLSASRLRTFPACRSEPQGQRRAT